VLDTNKGAV